MCSVLKVAANLCYTLVQINVASFTTTFGVSVTLQEIENNRGASTNLMNMTIYRGSDHKAPVYRVDIAALGRGRERCLCPHFADSCIKGGSGTIIRAALAGEFAL